MAVSVQQGLVEGRAVPADLAWSVAQAPKHEGNPNGDGYLLIREDDRVVLAVVDGVGSGADANAAAETCLHTLKTAPRQPLESVFARCHQSLSGTRGAALAMICVDLASEQLEWAAVGDIDGCIFRGAQGTSVASMVQKGGTLGHQYTGIHLQNHALKPGDLIAISSDGVSRRYRDHPPETGSTAAFAETCLGTFGRQNDDRTFAALSFHRRAQ